MLLLGLLVAFLAFGAGILYWLLGTNRYGGDRPASALQITATASALANQALKPEPCRTIRVYFIKPSRYDEEGYVQYFRYGVQPNNTLTVLTALNAAFNKRYAVERNVRLETVIWDEICDGVVSPETITAIKDKAREDGVELLIGLAGVQSNQYPRGRDLALQFVAEGIPTMMGGFHVSGFPDSCKFLNECGVTTVVGEAENIWGDIVEDFLRGELRLHYTVTQGIRAKTGQEDIIVPLITESLFLVDDDFFRSPRWEEILTGLVEVKKEHPRLSCMMQVDVDASCYANVAPGETEGAKHRRSKRFVELAARAGCYQAFVGIESLNPDNLNFATKYQNTDDRQHKWKLEAARAHVIDKYRRVVEHWHKVGVSVHAGYMLGFPFDGPDCGRVAAATLKKIGCDIVSFFIMTPLPGTEDQARFTKEGAIIDWDFNQLDSQHVTLKHDKLDKESWLGAYRDAYLGFYSIPRFLHTIFTVAAGRGLDAESRRGVLRQFTYYFFSYRQGRHPMVGGIWPIRRRDVRRAAITDDEARRFYLGNRFDAILRGDGGEGFAAAPA